jgi:choice-of-anchor A domain-containing protein
MLNIHVPQSFYRAAVVTAAAGLSLAAGAFAPAQAASLGAASNFNAFIFQTMNQQSDAEGRVAVGGNATFTNYGIGDRLPNSNGADNRLVVGGNLTYNGGQVFGGNAIYGGTASLNNVGITGGQFKQGVAIDFVAAAQQLTHYSAYLGSLATNSTTTYQPWGGIQLQGASSGLNIFTLDASKLSQTNNLQITAAGSSTVLINVVGTTASMQNFGMNLNGVNKQNVLFNFVNATQLSSSGVTIQGSVLAPLATYNFNNGNLEGTLVANSVSGTGEFHNYLFQGTLPTDTSAAVPEPTTIAGLLLAGAGLAKLKRKKASNA